VFEIPLFPLNTVLFPGVPLNLHIFETRYREMVGWCLDNSESFGVVLIRSGRESLGPLAKPYEVGCLARILKAEPLDDGRINIATMGLERFRILELDRSQAYLVGQVESFPLEKGDQLESQKRALRLRKWVEIYLSFVSDELPEKIESKFLPDNPVALAYIAAYLVQAPAPAKQDLLEAPSVGDLLSRLEKLYRREIALVREISQQSGPTQGNFSMN
jgi:Lon protease-like protein